MAHAFGAAAYDYATALDPVASMVIAEDSIGPAYFQVVERRKRADPFFGMLMLDDARTTLAYKIAGQLAATKPYHEQRLTLELLAQDLLQVDGRALTDLTKRATGTLRVMRDLIGLFDVLLVPSFGAMRKLRESVNYSTSEVERWIPDRDLGDWTWKPRASRTVVVWAPTLIAEDTAIFTVALHGLHAEVVVACNGGNAISKRATYLQANDPALIDIISSASCLIDASASDPSWSYAFAKRGVPLVCSTATFADEWVEGAAVYIPTQYRTIQAAAMQAFGARGSRPRAHPPSHAELGERLARTVVTVEQLADVPLVSVVIPTFNRRADLEATLRFLLDKQQYPNFEVVLVNDGGESVADFGVDPRVRVFDREENVGVNRAVNFGIAQARGTYVQLLADDDALFPDHLMRLVAVLERTGASIAHGDTIIRYESTENGVNMTHGYNASIFANPLERTEALTGSPIAGQGMLFRKTALDLVGYYDERLKLSDQEMQIRLSKEFDFIHVPVITNEWLVRDSAHNFSRRKDNDIPGELEAMWALHPAPGDTYVEKCREETMAAVRSRPAGYVFRPSLSRLSEERIKEVFT